MRIRTRLQIVTSASVALVVIMALLFYWSQHRLATANKAKNLADEIVSSVFERNTLKATISLTTISGPRTNGFQNRIRSATS